MDLHPTPLPYAEIPLFAARAGVDADHVRPERSLVHALPLPVRWPVPESEPPPLRDFVWNSRKKYARRRSLLVRCKGLEYYHI